MMPILFSIGPFNVYAFGFFLALSFVFSTFIIYRFAKEELKEEEYLDAYFFTSLTVLVFARVVYILRNIESFKTTILKYILVTETPGLSLWGGLTAGLIFLFFYSRRKKFDILHIFDLFSVALSLCLMFIKIGQILGGAAFGKETDFFLKVRIVGLPNYHHPVELYEAFLYFFLFILLNLMYRLTIHGRWPKGITFFTFSIITAIIIFSLEFLKVYNVYLYGLSFRHIIALSIMVFTLVPLVKRIYLVFKIYKKVNK